jgi:hypothetical protein
VANISMQSELIKEHTQNVQSLLRCMTPKVNPEYEQAKNFHNDIKALGELEGKAEYSIWSKKSKKVNSLFMSDLKAKVGGN